MKHNAAQIAMVAMLVILAGIGIKFFYAAGSGNTVDLPHEHARGNPLALRELEKRPYDSMLSRDFREMARHPDAKVRVAAISYLAKGNDPAEAAVIIGSLGDDNPDVRAAAAEACGARNLEQSMGVLITLLDDPAIQVKGAAQSALRKITGVQGYRSRSEWEQYWRMHREGFK